MKALTKEEVEKLLAASTGMLRAQILIAFRHGTRVSELCRIRWSDIDLSAKTIRIAGLKHGLTTVMPLGGDEVEALEALPRTSEYVFPMSRVTFWRHLKGLCHECGIATSNPHALRHALGRALVRANVTLPIIKKALRHKSLSATAVYTDIEDTVAGNVALAALEKEEQW